MKSAFNTETLRSITHSLGRFLAIAAIVALGTGFYAGLRMTAPDMKLAADEYFDGTSLMDIRVLSTLGLTDDDIAALRHVEGVEAVMPARETDVMASIDGEQYATRVHSLPDAARTSDTSDGVHARSDDPDYLNRPLLVRGSWPQKTGECVLSANLVENDAIAVGDTLTITEGVQDVDQTLVTRTYTVTGFVNAPYYATSSSMGETTLGSGSIQQYMYVPESDFSADLPYTEAYLAVRGVANERASSDAYQRLVDEVADRIKALAPEREQARVDQLKSDAQKELDEKRADYEGERADAQSQLDDAKRQLDDAAARLQDGRAQLEQGRADYDSGLAEYEQKKSDADAQLADAERRLDDAQKQIDDLERPEWLVMDRTANYGAASFEADADRVDSIAAVFPFIFFLVAALVALTTMTRMVEEERALIGTFKALGYRRTRIASKYLAYAAAASGIGSILGILALSQVLPAVIMKAYGIIYFVPELPLPLPVDPGFAGLAAGLGVGVTLFATWAAVAATLRERPAQLMLPRAPKAGKRIVLERIGPLWRHLSFSWKVTFRNLFRYKKRFVMTVIGIAGCTALLLTGLGLSNAINDIIDKQFGEITKYNAVVTLADDLSSEEQRRIDDLLDDGSLVTAHTLAMRQNMLAGGPDEQGKRMELVVPEDPASFDRFVALNTRVGHHPVKLDDDGFVLTEKLAAELGVRAGDAVTLTEQDAIGNATGTSYEATVTGIVENYVYHYAYMGPALYEQLMGKAPDYRTVLAVTTSDPDLRVQFSNDLLAAGGVKTVAYNDETIDAYRDMMSSVNMIVVVLVTAAAALAFIVLYNLTNINITERMREIATLKVLGFTPREMNAYIFREIFLLAAIGCAVGLVLGVWMEGFVVVTAEVDQIMFGRAIHPTSFLLAFLLTMLFTVLVMLAMRGKLRRIDMVESLKSNE